MGKEVQVLTGLVVYRGHSYTRTIVAIGLVLFDVLLNFSILFAILKKGFDG